MWGCLVGDESKYLDRANTLFIWVFQLWQLPFHCRSSVVFITPSTSHPRTPFLPLGPGIPVSHVLSVRLQAPLIGLPNYLLLPFSFFSPHPSRQSLCISLYHLGPRLALHFVPSVQSHSRFSSSQLCLSESLFILYFVTFCLVCLTSNLVLFPPPLAGVRRATMDYAVTSLFPRQMLSCQTQVRFPFYFIILKYIDLWHDITRTCCMPASKSLENRG